MTTYTITAIREDDTTFTDRITAATPAEAKKTFRSTHRHGDKDFTITDCEVYAENVTATKQQEREALEKIKAIIATLGPSSYIATAFAGCIEDADTNIEYDFGDSMKARWESEKKTSDTLRGIINDLQAIRDGQAEEIEKLEAQLKEAQQQAISDDDLEDIRQLVSEREAEQEEAAAKAAEEIVEYADDPTSKDFTEAVRLHRHFTSAAEYTRSLRHRVEAAQTARHNNNAGA